jgi:cardiolipin synthase
VPVVHLAAQHTYDSFLHHGVRIYEMFSTTLHAKTIAIDGLYSTVGSFNLDTWSDKRNLEVNIAIIDPQVANEVQSQFFANLENAAEVTLENWQKRSLWRRLVHWAAYQLLRL